LLKLVESIRYHYSLEKPVAITVQIVREVIAETIGFTEGSAPYIILANLKKREEKDRAPTSIFGSFLGKLSKGKGYASIEDSTQVNDPD